MSAQTLSPTSTEGPRTRGKREASRDFGQVTRTDVNALIQNAQEEYNATHDPASRKYWLAYWGRLIELRREDLQRRRRPGRYMSQPEGEIA